MIRFDRLKENPILVPDLNNDWEKEGTFNGCPVFDEGKFNLTYRALSSSQLHRGFEMQVSSIGYTQGTDGIHFGEHRLLIKPEEEWEAFGCEDPRITKIDGKYFIFYTALSNYPFNAQGIKVGLATTQDFQKIEKHPITPFNSKAMTLFPERINGKLAAILTVDTDIPPAKIALAYFEREEDIWSKEFWEGWFSSFNEHVIPLLRNLGDHLEVGAPPIKTPKGWLILYSYIRDYLNPSRTFGVEAVLLDLNNPQKIIGRTQKSMIVPEEKYELEGNVPNIVFPSGALTRDNRLYLYYGAADTTCCIATCNLEELLTEMSKNEKNDSAVPEKGGFKRFEENPIISPIPEFSWESRATFNPAAIFENNKVHLLYRAMSQDNTSAFGYAASDDGFHISERLAYPVYLPREDFEKKTKPFVGSGCEDPRLTKIGEKIYMCYTAYDGINPPRVAFTSITCEDFFAKRWHWEKPQLLSPLGVDDKDACLFPKKFDNKYLFFHRIGLSIWMDTADDLHFEEGRWLGGDILLDPRKDNWDNVKVGISAPPIETEKGWLLLYHGVSNPGMRYCLGAALLDLNNPQKVLARTNDPLFEPETSYEKEGVVPNVVFPCGAVVINDEVFIYYGGADHVVGVASASLKEIFEELKI